MDMGSRNGTFVNDKRVLVKPADAVERCSPAAAPGGPGLRRLATWQVAALLP
jgi:hypothetical protein